MMSLDVVVLTSMHSIACYSGFLYCSFGRPYALVVTCREVVTISAGIDAGQPWRRCYGDNITYTDWQHDITGGRCARSLENLRCWGLKATI